MAKKALLMILDGWGIGQHGKGDVIFNTPTPYLDYLTAVSAHSELQASGENVGLPDGQMGNSEVGHLNIGAAIVFKLVFPFLFPFALWCADALESRSILLDNAKLASFWLTANKSAVFYFFSCFFWQLRNKVITLQKI